MVLTPRLASVGALSVTDIRPLLRWDRSGAEGRRSSGGMRRCAPWPPRRKPDQRNGRRTAVKRPSPPAACSRVGRAAIVSRRETGAAVGPEGLIQWRRGAHALVPEVPQRVHGGGAALRRLRGRPRLGPL